MAQLDCFPSMCLVCLATPGRGAGGVKPPSPTPRESALHYDPLDSHCNPTRCAPVGLECLNRLQDSVAQIERQCRTGDDLSRAACGELHRGTPELDPPASLVGGTHSSCAPQKQASVKLCTARFEDCSKAYPDCTVCLSPCGHQCRWPKARVDPYVPSLDEKRSVGIDLYGQRALPNRLLRPRVPCAVLAALLP